MIEKGRHLRPQIERNERKCFVCKEDVEDEKHFVIKCPLYEKERSILFQACRENSVNFDLLNEKEKLVFIFTNESPEVTSKLAKFTFISFKIRDDAIAKVAI